MYEITVTYRDLLYVLIEPSKFTAAAAAVTSYANSLPVSD